MKNGTHFLRNALVIVQFSISIIIIAGTLVIFWQFRYMTNKDLGFDDDQLVVMERIHPLGDRIQTFKDELVAHNAILSASNSTAYLGAPNNNNAYSIKGRPAEETVLFHTFWTDEDFMETYRFELATPDSRFFSEDYSTDSATCLVNEAAVRKYNLEDPLNQYILWPHEGEDEPEYFEMRVVGVMKDHHFMTLKHEMGAQIVILKPRSWNWAGYLTVRLAPGKENVEAGLKYMEEKWKEFTDDQPFQYFFLDEELDGYYAEEKRTGAVTMIFSILAIFIASLGLFGLTLYNSQKRIREIGVRKVMGASEVDIIAVISRSVGYAVGISIMIAMPVAYFMMQNWLRDFPYNVGFQPILFISAALLAIIIAMVTVAVTSLRAARTNPAVALHYE